MADIANGLTSEEFAQLNNTVQYGRACKLEVFGDDFNGVDLSELRIKFSVKRSAVMTPNVAEIRVYNVGQSTALVIKHEFKKVVLQAGYQGNLGTIFQGNIIQVILGRESATDTYIDIIAGDGDRAYNFAVVNTTLAAGSSLENQLYSAISAMTPKGVTQGYSDLDALEKLPRGKVLYGNAKHIIRNIAQSTNSDWSIQNEKVNFLSQKRYLPGTAVVLTSKTGMIGTPQQTNVGVNIKCLLNPMLVPYARVSIDNKSIADFKIDPTVINSPANIQPPFNADGIYFMFVIEHTGDTRGIDWYSSLVCLNISPAANPLNAVQVGYG